MTPTFEIIINPTVWSCYMKLYEICTYIYISVYIYMQLYSKQKLTKSCNTKLSSQSRAYIGSDTITLHKGKPLSLAPRAGSHRLDEENIGTLQQSLTKKKYMVSPISGWCFWKIQILKHAPLKISILNPKMKVWKMIFLFKQEMFRFHMLPC